MWRAGRQSLVGLLAGAAFAMAPSVSAQPGGQTFESVCGHVFRNAGCEALMGRTRPEIEAQFGVGQLTSAEDEEYAYPAQGVVLRYEKDVLDTYVFRGVGDASGGAKAYKGKPAPGLEWGASEAEVIAKLGPPTSRFDLMKPITLNYDWYSFKLGMDNRLVEVASVDVPGLRARRADDPVYRAAAAAAEDQQRLDAKKRNTDRLLLEVEDMFDHVAAKLNIATNIVKGMKDFSSTESGFLYEERRAKEDQVRRLQQEAQDLIDAFLKKHEGKLPQVVVADLEAKRDEIDSIKFKDE